MLRKVKLLASTLSEWGLVRNFGSGDCFVRRQPERSLTARAISDVGRLDMRVEPFSANNFRTVLPSEPLAARPL